MYVLKKVIFVIVISIFIVSLYSCSGKEESTTDIKTIKDTSRITSCKEGMLCGKDSDCFDGECRQGVCKCQSFFCQKDEDCGEDRCCNQMNGSCYECIKDTGDQDITDIAGADINSDTPADMEVRDITDGITDTGIPECETDFNCNLEKPYCEPDRKICVECYLNEHCKSSECDTEKGICLSVVEDEGAEEVMDTGTDTCGCSD